MVHLRICPLSDEVGALYKEHKHYHEGDCGLDLFLSESQTIEGGQTAILKLGIKVSAWSHKKSEAETHKQSEAETHKQSQGETHKQSQAEPSSVGWLLMPRSSISKTPLRLCNSIGLIDAGYRGEVLAVVDNVKSYSHDVKRGERLFQAVAFDGKSMSFEVVASLEDSKTSRGEGGFGSTTTTRSTTTTTTTTTTTSTTAADIHDDADEEEQKNDESQKGDSSIDDHAVKAIDETDKRTEGQEKKTLPTEATEKLTSNSNKDDDVQTHEQGIAKKHRVSDESDPTSSAR